MAVSGAAASTSMGWKSLPQFRFLMTLFNVRLGYWFKKAEHKGKWFAQPAAWYFFREMLGWFDEKNWFLNLSDGGHIENLAAYELLRRRCKFIVCVDGGAEPGMECADLTRLQRYAEIDLGITLHYDLSDLRLQSNGFTKAHALLVKIEYPAPKENPEASASERLGWMLYLKLAMTGVEPVYVQDYKRTHPAFPHQTTADQLFDEMQFEAYRKLGECAMEEMFRSELVGEGTPPDVKTWFQSLATNLLPDNDDALKRTDQ